MNNETMNNDILLILDDLMGELDAIYDYTQHLNKTNDERLIKNLVLIRKKEEVIFGNLLANLFSIYPSFKNNLEEGIREFNNI